MILVKQRWLEKRHEQWVVGYPLKLLAMKKQNGYRTLNDLAFLFLKINQLVPFIYHKVITDQKE